MSRSRKLLMGCLLLTGGAFGGDIPPSDLLPAGTFLVAGASLRALFDSPLLRDAPPVPGLFSAALKGTPLEGFELKRDLDSVVFGASGTGDNAPALAILRGRFTARPGIHHSGTTAFVILDERTAIIGSVGEVEAALARRGQPSALSPRVAARIDELAARYDFWAFGDIPKGVKPGPGVQGFDSVDRFEFAGSLRESLELQGEIHLRNPDEAAKMASLFKLLEAMAKAQPSASKAKLDFSEDHGTIRMAISVPAEELKAAMARQTATFGQFSQGKFGFGGLTISPAAALPKPSAAAPTIVTNDRGETVQVTLPGK